MTSGRWLGITIVIACLGVTAAQNATVAGSCDGIAIPYWGDETDKRNYGLFILYGLVMAYIFGGVAVAADAFMGSIEAITAETTVVSVGAGSAERMVEVEVWNKTVSNLSLMALGSSAPEILLAIIEVIGNDFEAGDLGPGTIVGSAAFNMLVIIAICVSIQPVKKVEAINVLYITAAASVFAYFWLYLMVEVITPGEVHIWEAAVTCGFFPLLLLVAFAADKGWLDSDMCHHHVSNLVGDKKERHDKAAMKHLVSVGHVPVHAQGTSEWNTQLRRAIRAISKEEPKLSIEQVYVKAFERVKSHDHAPVLEGERKRTMDREAREAYKANAAAAVAVAVNPVVEAKEENGEGEVEPGAAAPVNIVTVRRSSVSNSSLGGAVHKVGFPQSLYKCIEQDGKIYVPVKRRGNLNMPLQICVTSKDSTAAYGVDYSFEGDRHYILDFLPGENIKEIEVNIVNHEKYHPNHHFFIELKLPSHVNANDIKWTNHTTKIRIIDEQEYTGCWDCLSGLVATLSSREPADSPYLEQIRCALRGDDGEDDVDDSISEDGEIANPAFEGAIVASTQDDEDDGTSCFGWFVYIYLVVPSVLLAIFSVPVSKWHGWGAFVTSLMWIGIWTLLAGDLATGMGCTVGLADTVTAITFVALGTSVPDTFASKIAAENDESADPAIGNVTGSNAVNVFLGVGLSWLVGSIYQESNGNTFKIAGGALAFSVLLFTIFAVVWFFVLTVRRYVVGGELGGSGIMKWGTVVLFVTMWFMFILLVSLVEYGDIDVPF